MLTVTSTTINLALCNVSRQMTLALSSICGTLVKLRHCPPSCDNLMNKIAVTINRCLVYLKGLLLETHGKIYVTVLKTHTHKYIRSQPTINVDVIISV